MAKLMRRMRGEVALWRDGTLLLRKRNLIVNSGLNVSAQALAGTANYKAAVMGFGSGNTAPQLTDTGLTLAPKYWNALSGSPAFPNTGSVTFAFLLQATDYAAANITVQELALYANTGGAVLPNYSGTGFGAWTSATTEVIGNLIADSNGNIQRISAVTSDAKTGGAHPTWATTIGATTTDNHVTWTMVASGAATSGLLSIIAHVVVPAFAFTGAANYTGNWTITY